MEGVEIRPLNVFTDSRGWLAEIYREDEALFRPVMTYVSVTKPGIGRGPHEHAEQADFFCFLGDFRLYLWDNRPGSATYGQHTKTDLTDRPHVAIVPPGVVHAYKNIGTKDGLVFNLPDRLYKGPGKTQPVDETRYEDDINSPYKMD